MIMINIPPGNVSHSEKKALFTLDITFKFKLFLFTLWHSYQEI